jgi:serine/threonine-protein kinase HipA
VDQVLSLFSHRLGPVETALILNGKKSKLRLCDFQQFGQSLQLTPRQMAYAFKRCQTALPEALNFIDATFLPASIKKDYQALIRERSNRLW